MGAPKGNKFWMARAKHGRKLIFADESKLWNAAQEYFTWAEANPLLEEKVFHYQGDITRTKIKKMRAMTIAGLCLFLDCSTQTWREYCKHKDFSSVTTRIENVIRGQKFAGAAADLLNPNIIARDLGLSDKKETTANVRIIATAQDEDI